MHYWNEMLQKTYMYLSDQTNTKTVISLKT